MSVRERVDAHLDDHGAVESWLGEVARSLAAQMDNPETSASAAAACSRELRATLRELTGESLAKKPKQSKTDELRARRQKRHRRAEA